MIEAYDLEITHLIDWLMYYADKEDIETIYHLVSELKSL